MKTILVAEDDMISRMIVVKIVQAMGHKVIESENGQIAYDYLMKNPDVDMLITDIIMPEMDGRVLVNLLRNDETFAQLPIIFVSGVLEEDEILGKEDQGPTRYLPKPVDREKLEVYIHELLKVHA